MRTPSNPLLLPLCGLVLLAACTGDKKESGPPPVYLGVCHKADVVPACSGSAPDRLGSSTLGTGFFTDVFAAAGLTGQLGRRVTFGDVNGDRFPDLFAVETGVAPGLQHLRINVLSTSGTGRMFAAVADTANGIRFSRAGGTQTALMGTFADVDGDGDLDLFSGSYSQDPSGVNFVADPNEIYLNDGAGNFTLKTDSGVNEPWPLTTSAVAFLDYDLDGVLDMFVGNFMVDYPNLISYQDELYRGAGGGVFTLATADAGLTTDGSPGDADGMYKKPTYGAVSCDWNDDGWPDILTSTYALGWDDLWKNLKNGTFENVAQDVAFHMDDKDNPDEQAWRDGGNTFSAACGDYDNDGDFDVFTSETTHGDFPRNTADRSRILRNRGRSHGFAFERPDLADTGIDRSLNASGPDGNYGNEGDHGASWVDLDNDGLLDLVIEASAYPMSHAWIYHQLPGHVFENVTEASGQALNLVNTNGLSLDDFDRDGDIDVVTGSVNTGSQQAPGGVEQVHLWRNDAGAGQGNSLYVTLRGVSANRHGIGAKITLTAGCLTQTREIQAGKGTFGAADPAFAYFGLGDVARVDRLEIRWPTDPPTVQRLYNLEVNQFLEVTEGSEDLFCEGRQ